MAEDGSKGADNVPRVCTGHHLFVHPLLFHGDGHDGVRDEATEVNVTTIRAKTARAGQVQLANVLIPYVNVSTVGDDAGLQPVAGHGDLVDSGTRILFLFFQGPPCGRYHPLVRLLMYNQVLSTVQCTLPRPGHGSRVTMGGAAIVLVVCTPEDALQPFLPCRIQMNCGQVNVGIANAPLGWLHFQPAIQFPL